MRKMIARWLEDAWYREMYISAWFMPLSMLYVDAIRLRRYWYKTGVLASQRLPVPVVIVGNLTVGGTGKTPLVVWLVDFLKRQGYKPGVISRGYGGAAGEEPRSVGAGSDPALVGDEALLLANRCDCPVVVCPDRPAAGRFLLAHNDCDVIVSDDGLQHYALQRDLEIVVLDGERRFGNGYCLPVGPLREPPERIKEADLVVVNGGNDWLEGEFAMQCLGDTLINLASGEVKPVQAFAGQACYAVAGIGNPNRFFRQLEAVGLDCDCRAFPDHHPFAAADLAFEDEKPVLMTEKDAVKCRAFAKNHHWYLPVEANLPDAFADRLLTLLTEKTHG